MSAPLDLRDIQGNIVRAYGRYGYPHARYFLFHIRHAASGRAFIATLLPHVTTAERWADPTDTENTSHIARPPTTLNVALSFRGLEALDLPTQTLAQLPPEFIDGMARRCHILSDVGPSGHKHWDPVWHDPIAHKHGTEIHVLVSISARMQPDGTPVPELEEVTDWLRELGAGKGIKLLSGHDRNGADYQQAGARLVARDDGNMRTDAGEHFGFEDGIGNPVFAGQYPPQVEARRVKGRGKIMADQSWEPLATGEFLIGHVDESQELPFSTRPPRFMYNGTFLAFRKLHENAATFRSYVDTQSADYAKWHGIPHQEADVTLRAKMIGRWPNGVPLMTAPTYGEMMKFEAEWADIPALKAKIGRSRMDQARLDTYDNLMIDFKYRDDPSGARCPISAHIRRGNMRDMLDPRLASEDRSTWDGSALTNRRRILRRGLPYGPFDPEVDNDSVERGVIFIAMCANIFRQFEFVLQQWVNYGLDLNQGNDNCPVLGFHDHRSKFIIQSEPDSETGPWVLTALPQFVETRGGEYFFVPSLNTLNMIALGVVDPT